MSKKRGFITIAIGSKYAEMALDMALSAKEFHTEPISIAVDKKTKKYLDRYKKGPFDQIITLPRKIHPWGAKFLLAEVSPYEYTVFVDADILFLKKSPFFEYEFTAPIAMYGAYMFPESDFQTYYSGKKIMADFGLSRYFWATAGIFVFKSSEVKEMFKACYEFYTSEIKKYPSYSQGSISEEMVLGIMSNKYPIDSLKCPTVHPWPLDKDISKISPSDDQWPVFHVFGPPNKAFMENLMEMVTRRRLVSGFPLISEKIWRNKAYFNPTILDKLKHINRKFWRKFGH